MVSRFSALGPKPSWKIASLPLRTIWGFCVSFVLWEPHLRMFPLFWNEESGRADLSAVARSLTLTSCLQTWDPKIKVTWNILRPKSHSTNTGAWERRELSVTPTLAYVSGEEHFSWWYCCEMGRTWVLPDRQQSPETQVWGTAGSVGRPRCTSKQLVIFARTLSVLCPLTHYHPESGTGRRIYFRQKYFVLLLFSHPNLGQELG